MDIKDIIKPENKVYAKTPVLTDNILHYCPGCTHGTVHKIIAEVIEEMGIQDKAIGISPVGCSVFAYNYIDIDWQQAAHGRAPALATATKRLNPDRYVFTYQGDGDLASIGTAEVMHACNRGENIVIIFINNAIYGIAIPLFYTILLSPSLLYQADTRPQNRVLSPEALYRRASCAVSLSCTCRR